MSPYYFGGGGGGSGYAAGQGGTGGIGGGGGGALGDTSVAGKGGQGGGSALNAGVNGSRGLGGSWANVPGGSAGANTGGGGGGGSHYNSNNAGGGGGSGIVIIRYLGRQRAVGGVVSSLNGYTIHTFLTDGTFSTAAWVDKSGNGNTGTLTNGPIYSSANGGSIVFDGVNKYVACGNLGAFYPQGTVSFWMNAATIASYPNPFATHFQGSNVGFRFEGRADGNFNMVVGNDAGTYTPHTFIASGMSANTWYNITFTWIVGSNIVAGYLNGVQVFNEAQTYWATTMPSVTIGNGFSNSRYWNGNISVVQIYNRALSAAEVKQNFNATRSRYGI
jgi:hypothetical protein